jgi:hypothetical protein
VVGYSRRVGNRFFFEIGVNRIIFPEEWQDKDEPLEWVAAHSALLRTSFFRSEQKKLSLGWIFVDRKAIGLV